MRKVPQNCKIVLKKNGRNFRSFFVSKSFLSLELKKLHSLIFERTTHPILQNGLKGDTVK